MTNSALCFVGEHKNTKPNPRSWWVKHVTNGVLLGSSGGD